MSETGDRIRELLEKQKAVPHAEDLCPVREEPSAEPLPEPSDEAKLFMYSPLALASTGDLLTWCIVCRKEIPEDRRKRRSNTCSREHSKILRDGYRRETDKKRCRACAKPSTPEQRAAYRAWLKENPQFRPGAAAGKRGWPKGRKRTTAGTLGPVVAEDGEHGVEQERS